MKRRALLYFLFSVFSFTSFAQIDFPKNGVAEEQHNFYAFTHANIYVTPDELIRNATLLVRDGVVKEVGTTVSLPKNTVVFDLKGKYIYPSFIDLYSNYGMSKTGSKENPQKRSNQLLSKSEYAAHWNENIHPEVNAIDHFKVDKKTAKELRDVGFGVVLSHSFDGIIRGTSCLVMLSEDQTNKVVLSDKAANQYAFKRGSTKQMYPTSLMGIIALIRQHNYDVQWYESQKDNKKFYSRSLEASLENESLPEIIEAGNAQSVLRAVQIAQEFERNFIVKASTDAYQRIEEIKASNATLIVPLNFPKPYELSAAYDELNVSLGQMKHWEMAPFNTKYLNEWDVPFVLTAHGLEKNKSFIEALRKVKHTGLASAEILRALTETPAKIMGMDEVIGSLTKGKRANFFITTNELFDEKSILLEHWLNGKKYSVRNEELDIRGNYNLNINKNTFQLQVSGDRFAPKAVIPISKEKVKVTLNYQGRTIEFSFSTKSGEAVETYRLSGVINDEESRIWAGKAIMPDGSWADWAAIRQGDYEEKSKSDTAKEEVQIAGSILHPNKAYGFDSLPSAETIIFQNATLWTNEDTGIIQKGDIAISDGKIIAIGDNLTRVGLFGDKEVDLLVVDATGKHITSGIIDEHSHIAVSGGVNEAGWNTSAEVRIGDVINANDINIYRQLAGGVTAAQLLHGSANPIGGQSALIKMRWGRAPEEMKIEGADRFIKFALGENVKQSNWGDHQRIRFPQTRMGVEQVYYDAFTRAREYQEPWMIHANAMENKKRKQIVVPPRKDLRLEALMEIIDTNRFITCHSYIQSEINMLMHVADSMRFRVNTFTHVLEGYKIADKIGAHGAGASTFSDWWAYKFEVNDAIPYNGAILHQQGVLTAFNSDDAEMGRRLNQEAAKAVKYGGVSEEEAWKFVTLNPAKMLHLDDRMGSLRVGKDADIVVWSDNPLSITAKAEQTFIDGICYFDWRRDQEMRERDRAERTRIVQKMLAEKKKGKPTQPAKKKEKKQDTCESLETEEHTWLEY